MIIDVTSLFVANAVAAAVACLVLLVGGGIGRSDTGLRYLTGALALLTVSLLVIGLRDRIPNWLSSGVGNTILAASVLGMRFAVDRLMESASRRAERVSRRVFVASVFGLALLVIWLPFALDSSYETRSGTSTIAIAMLYALCAFPLLRGLDQWMGRTHYLIGGTFTAAALLLATRGVGVLTGAVSGHLTEPAAFNIAVALIGQALIVVGSIGFVLILRERELGKLAMLDGLTGILNRRAFLETLGRALASAQRSRFPCSVALVDLDLFKHINDTHGHRAGDDVLRQFADLARNVLRRGDALGRYGGEEFVLLLYECAASGAQNMASRLQAAMAANPARSEDLVIPFTASIGIAEWRPGDPASLVELLQRADQAMYEAKARGRNCIVRHDELVIGAARASV